MVFASSLTQVVFNHLFFSGIEKTTYRKKPPFSFLFNSEEILERITVLLDRHFLCKKGGDYHDFLATPPPYVHPACKSHKARSNASCIQVSTANFTQTSHPFWMPIRVWVSRGESHAESPVQEESVHCYAAARAGDPSPRVIPPVFWPHTRHNLKAKKVQGIGLLIRALWVLWRGCRRWRQPGCIS